MDLGLQQMFGVNPVAALVQDRQSGLKTFS